MSELIDLAPPDPHWKGTGCIFRPDDIRDYHLEFLPQVADALAAGLPSSFMSVEIGAMPFCYDQGQEGACCPNSICGSKSIEDFADLGRWQQYDAHGMYADLGGKGPNGIAADPALKYTRDIGCRAPDNKRYHIGSYMFAPRNRNEWRNTLAAALVSSGPCVVATLLPANFGWESSGAKTSGYHQMCLAGYEGLSDNDWAVLLNSWGPNSGNNGFVRLKWGYLEDGGDFQDKHVYGYQMIDVKDYVVPDPDPEPLPDPEARPNIRKVKQPNRQKFKVIGDGFHPDSVLWIDGDETSAAESDGHFVLKMTLDLGMHNAVVSNPNGKASVPYPFTVIE